MSEHSPDHSTATLSAHIRKHLLLLEEAVNEIAMAEDNDIPKLGKTPRAGVIRGVHAHGRTACFCKRQCCINPKMII